MKQSEVKGYSLEELKDKLAETQNTFSAMRRTHVVSPVENTSVLRGLRRTIARLKTAINNQ
ncbi:MAG: 50S ribosomal protein L29 [Nonlabens sp.]|jgi:large subunit ribosomal protein L29|nr:50S ribosomal protein L29 [Nonlabens sp.]